MNTNGANTTENRNYGAYCYDYAAAKDEKINNDYLELMQAFTSTGTSQSVHFELGGIFSIEVSPIRSRCEILNQLRALV